MDRSRRCASLLFCLHLIGSTLGAPPNLDQRQEGRLNLQLSLDNFLVVLATPAKTPSSDLADFGIFGQLPVELFDVKRGSLGAHERPQYQLHQQHPAEFTDDKPKADEKRTPHQEHLVEQQQQANPSPDEKKPEVEDSPSVEGVESARKARSQKHNHKHKVIDKSEPLAAKIKVPTIPDKSEPIPKPIKFDLEATVHEITDKRLAKHPELNKSKEKDSREIDEQQQDGFPSLLELEDCGPGAVRSSVGICELLDGKNYGRMMQNRNSGSQM